MWRKRSRGESLSGLLTKAGLDYGRLGWSVIPVESRGKRPLIPWEVFQGRHPEAPEIGDWFRRWPNANIAVVTGAVSGVVVLDLDPRHGAEASLAALEREYGPTPATVEVRTGGGGRHLYFAHPGELVRNRVGIAPGVDLRGDGGYVVAPPSIHASGEAYRWERSPEVYPLVALPAWPREAEEHAGRRGHPVSHWRHLLREGITEGERNNTIASLAGHLLWHGVDEEVATELLLTWCAVRCHPPLEPGEVARTVASIARLHRQRDSERD